MNVMQEATTNSLGAQADMKWIGRAVSHALPNALRLALIELTEDPELIGMTVSERPARGGAMIVPVLSGQDTQRVAEKARAYLASGPAQDPLTSRERAAELLRLFGSDISTPERARLALDDLGYPEPFAPGRSSSVQASRSESDVTIIGAGVSGIALAIQLKEVGIPFRIIERQSDIGGTWHLNTYPEARVDVTNFIYQFRSERNYPWQEIFASQSEIKKYLAHIVSKNGLSDAIELGCSVVKARWDAAGRKWNLSLRTADGTTTTTASSFLVSAAGLFNTPQVPEIDGLENFGGRVVHTAGWSADVPVAGKRVGLVGNGSSGVQLMPWLARNAHHLTIFQRSPNWIMPVEDYRKPVSPELRWLFGALPTYWKWHCHAMAALDRQVEDLQTEDIEFSVSDGGFNPRLELYRRYLERHIRRSLEGRPDLEARCIPTYPPLARRLVADSGWFEALRRDDVSLVSERIERIESGGARTADGAFHPLDTLVLATGFRASEALRTVHYEGVDGCTMDELWQGDGARAYLGMFLPGFPNFAMFYGPNGQPQSGSFHAWAVRCARLVSSLIVETTRRDEQFEISRSAYDAYNDELDGALRRMIWGRGGASGYYINEQGRPITKMPWAAEDYLGRISPRSLDMFFQSTA